MKKNVKIKISPEKIFLILGIITVLFFIANLAGYTLKYLFSEPLVKNFTLINLDLEKNIPTYFSSLILMSSGLLLAWIAVYKYQFKKPFFIHWAVFSLILIFMSIDESACMHELCIRPLRSLFDLSGFFYFAWVIPGIFFVVVFMFFFAKLILSLPVKTKQIFIAAGAIYIMGVIGMEMIDGHHASIYGRDNFIYGILTSIEETLEMIGVILFLYGLMDYLRILGATVNIDFE